MVELQFNGCLYKVGLRLNVVYPQKVSERDKAIVHDLLGVAYKYVAKVSCLDKEVAAFMDGFEDIDAVCSSDGECFVVDE